MFMDEIALFVVPVLITIFTFALIKGAMDSRSKARSERTRLLEEALKNPAVDRATVESLAYQLTGARSPRRPNEGAGRLMAIVLAFGWMALFVGIGVWVLGEYIRDTDTVAGGIVTLVVGFGLVTYPFALRELESRRVQQ